jgi:aerobic carbon-monoxide dehydrogenase large subunit
MVGVADTQQGPIGRNIPRREDRRLLTGTARFIDDIAIAGALHARFVRSPHAHARILGVDADAARALPGVVTVVTGRDLAKWTQPLRIAPSIEGLHPVTVETMPTAKIRFHGDPVACVVATDRAIADDAVERVRVDYEALRPVTSIDAALAPGAPQVDDALPDNLVSHQHFAAGDPDRRFAEAHRVVQARFEQHRQTHVPMEPRGCCAVWDAGRQHRIRTAPRSLCGWG